MAEALIVKRGHLQASTEERGVLRRFLFENFDGLDDSSKKRWRKFWSRILDAEIGEIFRFESAFPRNYRFHKKFFALLTVGFEAWHPALEHNGLKVQKDFERFREDVTILAGYYTRTWGLDGRMRLDAQSISFAHMEEPEFEKLYSRVIDVLLDKVLTNYKSREEVDAVVMRILEFDS